MKTENYNHIEKLLTEILNERKISKLNDEEFSKSEKIKTKALKIIWTLKWELIKTTYNNLTNLNYHILVKILNYNWFFKWDLSKNLSEELKKLPIIK